MQGAKQVPQVPRSQSAARRFGLKAVLQQKELLGLSAGAMAWR